MSYHNHSIRDEEKMLKFLGLDSIDSLFSSIPEPLRLKDDLAIEGPLNESQLVSEFESIASDVLTFRESFKGAGAYNHFIPAAVDEVTSRQEFYTAYTPYQPEVSQGTLQTIFEYQTMMCDLTGLDVSNASMYDGASATAESILMAMRFNKRKKVLISSGLHPEYIETVKTYLRNTELEVELIPLSSGKTSMEALSKEDPDAVSSVVIQNPNFFGIIEDFEPIRKGFPDSALIYVTNEALSLSVLKTPGEYSVDICCGDAQSFGIPLSFGGPYLGFITCTSEYLHYIPGRLVGATYDNSGKRAFTMTLSAREQHIRRERATSNICSNHALSAIRATVYLSLMGNRGIEGAALLSMKNSHLLLEKLSQLKGFSPVYRDARFFHEFLGRLDIDPERFNESLKRYRILGPLNLERFFPDMENLYLFNTTEMNSEEGMNLLIRAIEEASL